MAASRTSYFQKNKQSKIFPGFHGMVFSIFDSHLAGITVLQADKTMAEVGVKPCSNPGCDRPGTSSCSACKTTVYCCVICQTADWPRHKEECDGHLRKMGMANFEKVKKFHNDQNNNQTLRCCDLSLKKLQQMKNPPIEIISEVMSFKFDALNLMSRHKEGAECAVEVSSILLTITLTLANLTTTNLINSFFTPSLILDSTVVV